MPWRENSDWHDVFKRLGHARNGQSCQVVTSGYLPAIDIPAPFNEDDDRFRYTVRFEDGVELLAWRDEVERNAR